MMEAKSSAVKNNFELEPGMLGPRIRVICVYAVKFDSTETKLFNFRLVLNSVVQQPEFT